MNAEASSAPTNKASDSLPPGRYELDPMHTFAVFSVKHQLIGRVDGRFDSVEGGFAITDDSESPFDQIEVSIKTESIDTKVEMRDKDLRSARFLDVANYPTLSVRGGASRRNKEGGWDIRGEMTIRDDKQTVDFDVVVRGTTVDEHGKTRLGARATATLTRLDFDLTTELEQESGDAGGPDVWVRLDLEAVREPDSS